MELAYRVKYRGSSFMVTSSSIYWYIQSKDGFVMTLSPADINRVDKLPCHLISPRNTDLQILFYGSSENSFIRIDKAPVAEVKEITRLEAREVMCIHNKIVEMLGYTKRQAESLGWSHLDSASEGRLERPLVVDTFDFGVEEETMYSIWTEVDIIAERKQKERRKSRHEDDEWELL
jgi:hypothetical protein